MVFFAFLVVTLLCFISVLLRLFSINQIPAAYRLIIHFTAEVLTVTALYFVLAFRMASEEVGLFVFTSALYSAIIIVRVIRFSKLQKI